VSGREGRFVAFAPIGVTVVVTLLLLRGVVWAAVLVVAVALGIAQGRLASPAFRRRFDSVLGRVVAAVAVGAGLVVSWLLLAPLYLLVFVPAAAFTLVFVRRGLGRPPGFRGDGWIPREALGPPGPTHRGFGSEPSRPAPTRRSPVTIALATVTALIVADLALGAILTATGLLPPDDRGELGAEIRASSVRIMQTPPVVDEPWAEQFGQDMADFELRPPVYLPYLVRGFQSFESDTVNTTDEERRSYQPDVSDGVEPLRVAFFGGSVTFGVGQRDEHTIPSEFARLAEAAGVPVEVHNYGFPGWVAWQEGLYLERLQAAGHRFDLAIFLDGFNEFDVQAENHSFDPTHSGASTLSDLVAEFSELHESEPGAGDGLHELVDAYARASGVVRVVDGLNGPEGPDFPVGTAPPDEVADAALGIYDRARTTIDDVAAHGDTTTHWFWQPRREGWDPDVLARLGDDVVDLSHVFDGQGEQRYIDHVHTDEVGAQLLARAIWDEVAPTLPEAT
jgi:hypothetical protein